MCGFWPILSLFRCVLRLERAPESFEHLEMLLGHFGDGKMRFHYLLLIQERFIVHLNTFETLGFRSCLFGPPKWIKLETLSIQGLNGFKSKE